VTPDTIGDYSFEEINEMVDMLTAPRARPSVPKTMGSQGG
jgi:hypothetical protein